MYGSPSRRKNRGPSRRTLAVSVLPTRGGGGRASVARAFGGGGGAQRGAMGGDVVGQVLPKEGLTCLDVAVGIASTAIADAARHAEGEQTIVVECGGRQIRKHPTVAASLHHGSVDRAAGRKTQVPRRTGSLRTGR